MQSYILEGRALPFPQRYSFTTCLQQTNNTLYLLENISAFLPTPISKHAVDDRPSLWVRRLIILAGWIAYCSHAAKEGRDGQEPANSYVRQGPVGKSPSQPVTWCRHSRYRRLVNNLSYRLFITGLLWHLIYFFSSRLLFLWLD